MLSASDEQILLTIAEVAVAFAGFTTIVVAFANRGTNWISDTDSHRIRSIVEVSLVVVAAAFLPILLVRFAPASEYFWRWSSCLIFIFLLFRVVSHARRIVEFHKKTPIINGLLTTVFVSMYISLFLSASGFARGPLPYYVFLYGGLLVGAGNFSVLVGWLTSTDKSG